MGVPSGGLKLTIVGPGPPPPPPPPTVRIPPQPLTPQPSATPSVRQRLRIHAGACDDGVHFVERLSGLNPLGRDAQTGREDRPGLGGELGKRRSGAENRGIFQLRYDVFQKLIHGYLRRV